MDTYCRAAPMLGNIRSTCNAVHLVTTASSFGGHWGYSDAARSWVEGIAGSAGSGIQA